MLQGFDLIHKLGEPVLVLFVLLNRCHLLLLEVSGVYLVYALHMLEFLLDLSALVPGVPDLSILHLYLLVQRLHLFRQLLYPLLLLLYQLNVLILSLVGLQLLCQAGSLLFN